MDMAARISFSCTDMGVLCIYIPQTNTLSQVGNHVELAMEWLITHPAAEDAPEGAPPAPETSPITTSLEQALQQVPAPLMAASVEDAGSAADAQVAAAMTAAVVPQEEREEGAVEEGQEVVAAGHAEQVLGHAIPLLAKVSFSGGRGCLFLMCVLDCVCFNVCVSGGCACDAMCMYCVYCVHKSTLYTLANSTTQYTHPPTHKQTQVPGCAFALADLVNSLATRGGPPQRTALIQALVSRLQQQVPVQQGGSREGAPVDEEVLPPAHLLTILLTETPANVQPAAEAGVWVMWNGHVCLCGCVHASMYMRLCECCTLRIDVHDTVILTLHTPHPHLRHCRCHAQPGRRVVSTSNTHHTSTPVG